MDMDCYYPLIVFKVQMEDLAFSKHFVPKDINLILYISHHINNCVSIVEQPTCIMNSTDLVISKNYLVGDSVLEILLLEASGWKLRPTLRQVSQYIDHIKVYKAALTTYKLSYSILNRSHHRNRVGLIFFLCVDESCLVNTLEDPENAKTERFDTTIARVDHSINIDIDIMIAMHPNSMFN
ncbi:hypothetical protein BDA99DRAFT_536873 [Phascolomyces articulosus]|uniref:Uncharacterized protein n=1 Tax=Phascolomyces articulosus TaxID=60185 RepID=A0AAD5PE77_9FUNG|nr:hypothetical protein BDA99DRAFT_536873 [Phascolomyces articulosus]